MEGAPHRGQRNQIARRTRQLGAGGLGVVQHLAGFLQENVPHLVVVGEVDGDQSASAGRLNVQRRHLGLQTHRLGGGGDKVDQRLGQLAARRRDIRLVGRVLDQVLCFQHGGRQGWLVCHMRFVRQALQVARNLGQRNVFAHRSEREHLRLLDQPRFDGRGGGWRVRHRAQALLCAPHHRVQRASRCVESELRLGQLRLHGEHVDQEPECTEVARQAIKHTGLRDQGGIDFGGHQSVDVVAHAQQRRAGVVHAQHRQHAAHGRQLVRHRNQHIVVGGIAEEQVDHPLGLRQRGPQFLHHTAHGLPVGHAPVQLLHPDFERLCRLATPDRRNAVGQALHPHPFFGGIESHVLERGLDVQQGGGHFHCQRGRRYAAGLLRLRDRMLQAVGKRFTRSEQALQGFADQRSLFCQAAQAMHFAACHRRPRFLGGRHALARLADPGRVEAAQCAGRVVGRRVVREAVDLAHRRQTRRDTTIARRIGLGAKEQQVLRQPLGHIAVALLDDSQLREQARRDPLAENVGLEQALGLSLEHGRRQLPQRGGLQAGGPGPQAGADVAESAHGRCRRTAHQGQQLALEGGMRGRVGIVWHRLRIGRQFSPLPVKGPQIGRMDPVRAGRVLRGAVLRKQRQRRDGLAGQHARQVVEQGKRGALDVVDHPRGQLVRFGHAVLDGRLAGPQQRRRRRQADQFQRAHALVDLLARGAQHDRIDGVHVGADHRLGFLDETSQRLVRRIERAAQFVVHPRQRAQVVAGFHVAHRRCVAQAVHPWSSSGSMWALAAARPSRS